MFVLAMLLVVSPLIVLSVIGRRRWRPPAEADLPTVTLIARLAGVAAGALCAFATTRFPALGLETLLAGPLFGLCVLAGVLVGERLAPRPTASQRVAGLETRRIRDYLPVGSCVLAVCVTSSLVALMVTTGTRGSSDDLGRHGRALQVTCGDMTTVATPWPGWFYGVPTLAAVTAGFAAAVLVLRAVVRRPRPDTDSVHRRWDDLHRVRGAQAVVSGYGILVSLPLAGSSLIAAGAIGRTSCSDSSVATGLLFGIGVCATGALAWFATRLFVIPQRAQGQSWGVEAMPKIKGDSSAGMKS